MTKLAQVLRWTQDWGRARQLACSVAAAYGGEFSALAQPQAGVAEWLQLLSRVNVPCAVVSAFDRRGAAGSFCSLPTASCMPQQGCGPASS